MNSKDLRYIKTEENLKKALIRLMENQQVDHISVKALCMEAKCSRNAFYQHYETKFDLYEAILNDIIYVVSESSAPILLDQSAMGEKEIQKYTYKLIKTLYTCKKELTSLLKGNKMFIVFLGNALYQSYLHHYAEVTDKDVTDQIRLKTKYICFGITGFVEQWLSEDRIGLDEAQRQLDICTRDNYRKVRDLLI